MKPSSGFHLTPMTTAAAIDFNRITITSDVLGADGRVRVQKGATGTIRSNDRGHLGVLFDDSEHYVELSGCKRRFQEVPFLQTRPIGM